MFDHTRQQIYLWAYFPTPSQNKHERQAKMIIPATPHVDKDTQPEPQHRTLPVTGGGEQGGRRHTLSDPLRYASTNPATVFSSNFPSMR